MNLWALSLTQAAAEILEGRVSSAELVSACLERTAAVEAGIRAWAFLDRDLAVRQAEAADDHRKQGRALGPLHGVPVGVQDVFDTGDMPTELGSPLWAGRTPRRDAAAVARLRAAGAVILGKTVTAEYAAGRAGPTTNPADAARTPGGSASGSAAAVAAHMVPGAIGSQTAGGVIRPAALCGVVGFKPTHGLIPRSGTLFGSRTLDQVGVFARTVLDVARLAEALVGFDDEDPDTRPRARPPLAAVAASAPPLAPRLAFMTSLAGARAEPMVGEAFAELAGALGASAVEVELGAPLAPALAMHRTIAEVERAHAWRRDHDRGGEQLSPALRALIERGRGHAAVDYLAAVAGIAGMNGALEPVFDEFDAIVAPAAPGEPPPGREGAGDPVFCIPWTYLGTPVVTLPLLRSAAGLPLGVQLVGRRDGDARLLRTARWVVDTLAANRRRGSHRSSAGGRRDSRRAKRTSS